MLAMTDARLIRAGSGADGSGCTVAGEAPALAVVALAAAGLELDKVKGACPGATALVDVTAEPASPVGAAEPGALVAGGGGGVALVVAAVGLATEVKPGRGNSVMPESTTTLSSGPISGPCVARSRADDGAGSSLRSVTLTEVASASWLSAGRSGCTPDWTLVARAGRSPPPRATLAGAAAALRDAALLSGKD